jgi:pimeloyl-ACP methyl ester carboxylesterase
MNLNRLFTLLFLLTISAKLSAQNLPVKTTWEGTLGNIRLILRISEDSLTKQKTAEFDSPDQGAFGLKVSKLTLTKDSIDAYSSIIPGGFTGTFNAAKTELAGYWNQGGGKTPLLLKQVANKAAYNRPQMPKGPFPYLEEKVVYYNKDKSIQYGATLTLPNSAKNVPAVILITGSGQEDRDEALFGHKLFWVIADHLSRNGIAVLRVDDRGIGQTTGDVTSATSADFAKDVLVGIDYLKAHKGIDIKNIGLLGHSEGGMIAPLAALQSNDIAFIVSLAGIGVKGSELMIKQQEDFYIKAGFTAEEVNKMHDLYLAMTKTAVKNLDNDGFNAEAKQVFTEWTKQQTESFLKKSGFSGPSANDHIYQMVAAYFMPWTRYFVAYDPATTLSKITIPVLALNGDKDTQVSAT